MSRSIILFALAVTLLLAACGVSYSVDSPGDCPEYWDGEVVYAIDKSGPDAKGDWACATGIRANRILPIGEKSGIPEWVGLVVIGGAVAGFFMWKNR